MVSDTARVGVDREAVSGAQSSETEAGLVGKSAQESSGSVLIQGLRLGPEC